MNIGNPQSFLPEQITDTSAIVPSTSCRGVVQALLGIVLFRCVYVFVVVFLVFTLALARQMQITQGVQRTLR